MLYSMRRYREAYGSLSGQLHINLKEASMQCLFFLFYFTAAAAQHIIAAVYYYFFVFLYYTTGQIDHIIFTPFNVREAIRSE